MSEMISNNRPLTADERRLVHWMLEHSGPEARLLLPQLELLSVTPWCCPCGCASINFALEGRPAPAGPMEVLADFLFGTEADLSGIFVFAQSGVLAGIEVYGLAGDPPKYLPKPESLRPMPQ